MDFNFEPGPFASRYATLKVENVGGNGLAFGPATLTGDASGALPGTIALDNATGFNDYFQADTFGSLLSFDILLGGPALTPSSGVDSAGSVFAFSLFSDVNGTLPTLTTDTTDGHAITVDINADGLTTLHNYTTSVTPELPTGILLITALLCAGAFEWRRLLPC